MSILRTMNTGVTGVNAQTEAIGVIGDNIANVNTIGFKQQRTLFEDILGKAFGDGPGAGVRVSRVQQMFTQGALTNTGIATDVALNGDGFFVVKGSLGGIDGTYYSRAGQFRVDKDGNLVSPQGMKAQGYGVASFDSTGNPIFTSAPNDIVLPTAAISPKSTTKMGIIANLDASAPIRAGWPAGVVPLAIAAGTDLASASNSSTTVTVYDSLGKAHAMSVYFSKTAENQWTYHVVGQTDELAGGGTGMTEVGRGVLEFGTNGSLTSNSSASFTVSFAGAAPNQAITVNLGSPTATPPGTGLDGVTQFASPSSVSSQSQDGYSSGDLSAVNVDSQGVVSGIYSNGQKIPMAQLAVAKFRANDALARAGQSLWTDTKDSGTAAMGTAGSGGRGSISASALEQSNVDLAQQFINLIQHQRAFQASSKTINTADEMLQEVVNLKR